MKLKHLCLLSFSLAFLTEAVADDDYFDDENVYFEAQNDEADELVTDGDADDNDMQQPAPMSSQTQECLSPYHRVQLSLRHNEARGIGYHDGYTTLQAFGIYDQYSKYFMPFLDLRGHVFNNGKWAGNVGIGERTVIPCISHTFGSYLYYDVRSVGHHLTVNQISPGLELVGRRMEYRINGYFPLGNQKSHKYHFNFDKFDDNHIILKAKQYRAMRGGDAEIGVHITQSTKYDLYASGGTYYLHSPHASSWGGRTRLLGRYREYVTLEVAYSYDHLFRSIVEGNVAVTWPLGGKLKRTGTSCPQSNDLLLSRASFAPSRFEIPVVKKIHPRESAINPATGAPWVVWFVNNTSSSDGTFESPFPTLLQAQNASSPNDMIYVFPGDGTTTGMNAGITLQNGQTFLGSGNSHKLNASQGSFTIPAFTSSMPSVTNTTGNIVTLASGNEVSGFNFVAQKTNSTSVIGLSGTVGANINNNVFTGTVGYAGITIFGSGKVLVTNNQLTGNPANGQAIRLLVDDGLTMTGEASNNQSTGFIFGIGMNIGNNSTADYQISNNIVTGSQITAIFWGNFGTQNSYSQGTIMGNQLSTTDNPVIGIVAVPGANLFGTLNVTNNTIIASPKNGFLIDIAGNGNFTCNLRSNTIPAPTTAGFFGVNAITHNGSPTLTLSLINNTNADTYSLVNTSGTFNLEPLIGNTGILNTTNVNFLP